MEQVVARPLQGSYFEIEEFNHTALKEYFEQDALLFPVDTLIDKVQTRDFRFFLAESNFLKVVDTMEKFQKQVVNLDTQAGKDFVVFKRQLYQVYQI